MKVLCNFLILTFLSISLFSYSENVRVRSMETDMLDLTAKMKPRVASDGSACALLKVICPNPNLSFKSEWITGDVSYDQGEYYIFLQPSATSIVISSLNRGETKLIFSEYNINQLDPYTVYHAVIDFSDRLSVDERVRLYKPNELTREQQKALTDSVWRVKTKQGDYNYTQSEIDILKRLFEKGSYKAARMLGGHLIEKVIKGEVMTIEEEEDGEYFLRVAAEYGEDATAARELGDYYYNTQDFEQAFEYYFVAHSKGDPRASNSLALMMSKGLGTEKDLDGAAEIWRDLFWNQDHRLGVYSVEDTYIIDRLYAIKRTLHAAEDFTSDAIILKAKDNYQALKSLDLVKVWWSSKSKERRDFLPLVYNVAMRALREEKALEAACYFIDVFSAKDRKKAIYPEDLPLKNELSSDAVKVIQEKSDEGNIIAIRFLAGMYKEGKVVSMDLEEALKILDKGVALGNIGVTLDAAKLAEKLRKYKDSIRYEEMAYYAGDRSVWMVLDLANHYEGGTFVKKDPQKALRMCEEILENEQRSLDEYLQKKEKANAALEEQKKKFPGMYDRISNYEYSLEIRNCQENIDKIKKKIKSIKRNNGL